MSIWKRNQAFKIQEKSTTEKYETWYKTPKVEMSSVFLNNMKNIGIAEE